MYRIASLSLVLLVGFGLFVVEASAALATRVYYSFDEVADADASGGYTFNSTDYYADLSGNGHNAILMKESTVTDDNPVSMTAKFGNSFRPAGRLNGENNHTYLSVPHNSDLDLTGSDDFTFSLWTNANYENTWGHRGYYFGKREHETWDVGGASQGYAFLRRGGGGATDHRFAVNDSTGLENVGLPTDSGDRWDSGQWALWTFTYDGDAATDNFKAYINGQLQATSTLTSTDWSNTEPFVIAGRMGEHQRSFVWPANTSGDGYIDDFVALVDTLTGPEVQAMFELAENTDLGYSFAETGQLLGVHRDGTGSTEIGDLLWSYASTGFTGVEGELIGGGTDFQLLLDGTAGTGLIGAPAGSAAVPEPSTLAIAVLGLLGLTWCGWRQRKRLTGRG